MASWLVTARSAMTWCVGAEVAHHAHGPDREQHGEGLPDSPLEPGLRALLLHDGVGLAQERQALLGHLAEHADRQARARERLAPDDLVRQPETRPARAPRP